MTTNGQLFEGLLNRIQQAADLEEVVALLNEVQQYFGEGAVSDGQFMSLRRVALEVAADLGCNQSTILRTVFEYLLPLFVDRKDNTTDNREHSRRRELLARWIDGCDSITRDSFRENILTRLCEIAQSSPSKEIVWAIGAIGYRNKKVVEILRPIANRDNSLGDAAMGTLAGLGLDDGERSQLIELLRHKLGTGLRMGLMFSLQELADDSFLEVLLGQLKASKTQTKSSEIVPRSLLVSILSRIADRFCNDEGVQDRVWAAISERPAEAISSSETAARCDTPQTVMDYTRWICNESNLLRPELRFIHYERLAELIRPRQLAGWDQVDSDSLLAILEEDVYRDTQLSGRFITTDVRIKTSAIETSLMLGKQAPLGWLEQAIKRESSRHVQGMLFEVMACFQFDPLPPSVIGLILDERDINEREDTGELLARIGAIRLAQSAGTRQAFDVLVNCGLTYKSAVLRSTSSALADVASVRIDAGDTDIVDVLLERAKSGYAIRHRDAAIDSLCHLAAEGKLQSTITEELRPLLDDSSLSTFSRSKVLETIGFLPNIDITNIKSASIDGGREDLGWRAIEAHVRHGDVRFLANKAVCDQLALARVNESWSVPSGVRLNRWQVFLIGLLYRNSPDTFAPAVVDVLSRADSDSVYQLFPSILNLSASTPTIIVESLVARIYERFRSNAAETPLFNILGNVAPERLLSQNWPNVWSNWIAHARVALIEAIRNVVPKIPSSVGRAIALLNLLAVDSQYAVRRAAFRGLATISSESLYSNCLQWAKSKSPDIRLLAAEAAAWLPVQEFSDEDVAAIALAVDSERSVRECAKAIFNARRNRFWADQCLEKLLDVRTAGNQKVFTVFRYGHALSRLGDDETKRQLTEHLSTNRVPSHVNYWITELIKKIDSKWRKETKEWPEPWFNLAGAIEDAEGNIVTVDGGSFPAHFSLWQRGASSPSDLGEWGAVVHLSNRMSWDLLNHDSVQIAIPERSIATALVQSLRSGERLLLLHGSGNYPEVRPSE